jgi:hypothetical protein
MEFTECIRSVSSRGGSLAGSDLTALTATRLQDSPTEEDGFEPSVPREEGLTSSRCSTFPALPFREGPMVRIRLPPAASPFSPVPSRLTGSEPRGRFGIAVDAVFDSATLFRVEAVQMPPAIDRLQLRVPFPFCNGDSIGATASQCPRAWSRETRRAALVRNDAPAGFRIAGQANRVAGSASCFVTFARRHG